MNWQITVCLHLVQEVQGLFVDRIYYPLRRKTTKEEIECTKKKQDPDNLYLGGEC